MQLEFSLSLTPKPQRNLVPGKLILVEEPSSKGKVFAATSGCISHQYAGSHEIRGKGCLPPSSLVPGQRYSVSTTRLWLPNVKGIEGSFYPISPFEVRLGSGVIRGDFGIHFDANVPGSAGCIVITDQQHWDVFRLRMQSIRDVGFMSIPLIVKYYY